MPLRSGSKRYINLPDHGQGHDRETTPWYWRLIAMIASWMILIGYLILPGLYANEPKLKISQPVLTVFVVALLTAGYSFTALLCFACRNEFFQAEAIFRPALVSSALGLLAIAYNFLASQKEVYKWGTASISGTVIATASTFLYGALLLWTHRRIVKLRETQPSRSANLWSEQSFYNNFLQNMYPTAVRSNSQPPEIPLTEDDRIKQQMALLLMKSESPDTSSTTFHINMPDDEEERRRLANSSELRGTPPSAHPDWNRNRNRDRANSRPDSLSEQQAWDIDYERAGDRGRTQNRPSSVGAQSNHSRNVSREERRREIEMGLA